jgi:ureidoglycolate lyase
MRTQAAAATGAAITIAPLTAEAFAPYGEVIAHAASGRRHFFPEVLEHLAEAAQATFWVSRVEAVATLPLTVTMLERHPFSAQTFLPLTGSRYLVIVADSDPHGLPDSAGIRAFAAAPHQGVTYRRDVWHHGMTILEGPAEYAVLMHKTGRGDDDVFLDLRQSVTVALAGPAPAGV